MGLDGSIAGPDDRSGARPDGAVALAESASDDPLFPLPEGRRRPSARRAAVTHLHGAVVSRAGASRTPPRQRRLARRLDPPGEEQIAEYPIIRARARSGITTTRWADRSNVAAGLAGLYIIHDAYERSLNLPSGPYEIPLASSQTAERPDGHWPTPSDIRLSLRQRDRGERQALALPRGRAAQVPLPDRQRVECPHLRTEAFRCGGPAAGSGFLSDRLGGGLSRDTAILERSDGPNSPRV